ncbi:MAG: winged helix-turn-helix domain-containing protein [Desulfurococcaceae archaeon]
MPASLSRLISILKSVGMEFTVNDIVAKAGLSPSTARRCVREMVKQGVVTGFNGKYTVTDKGLLLLEGEAIYKKRVESAVAYVFTDEDGAPLYLKIDNVEKLYVALKYGFVPDRVIVHHLTRGFLFRWISEAVGAKMLARRIRDVKSVEELVKTLEEYAGLATRSGSF